MAVSGAFATAQSAALDFRPMLHMQEYLEQLEAEGRNPDYIRTVRNGLHHFAEFLRSENVISPEEITRMHLIRFQARCKEREAEGTWAKSYSIQVLKKARAWLNWLAKVEYIEVNPWVGIRVGTVKKQPKPLGDDELAALYQAHVQDRTVSPFVWHRRDVILTLLYGWALRINELAALTTTAMDLRLAFVQAKNKSIHGGDRKTQPYTPEIKKHVQQYLWQRGGIANVGEHAFLVTASGTPMTIEMIRQTISDLGKMAGVRVNPHRLRDTAGTNLLDDDVPVERVQLLFGHSDREMTLAYARVNDRKVYESIEATMDPRLRNLFSNTRDLRA